MDEIFREEKDPEVILQLKQRVALRTHLLDIYGFGEDIGQIPRLLGEGRIAEAYQVLRRLEQVSEILEKSAQHLRDDQGIIHTLAWFENGYQWEQSPALPRGLAALRPYPLKEGGIEYRNRSQQPVMVIKEDEIVLLDVSDDSILAGQQLGIGKWGELFPYGSDAYLERSIRIAVDHGTFKHVVNPELQEQIQDEIARSVGLETLYPEVTGLAFDPHVSRIDLISDVERALSGMLLACNETRAVLLHSLHKKYGDTDVLVEEHPDAQQLAGQAVLLEELLNAGAANKYGLMGVLLEQRQGRRPAVPFAVIVRQGKELLAELAGRGGEENRDLGAMAAAWEKERTLEGQNQGRRPLHIAQHESVNHAGQAKTPLLAVIALEFGAPLAAAAPDDKARVKAIAGKLREYESRILKFEEIAGTVPQEAWSAGELTRIKDMLREAREAAAAPNAAFRLMNLEVSAGLSRLPEHLENYILHFCAENGGGANSSSWQKQALMIAGEIRTARLTEKSRRGLSDYLSETKMPFFHLGRRYAPDFFSSQNGKRLVVEGQELLLLNTDGSHPWGAELLIGRTNPDGTFLPLASLIQPEERGATAGEQPSAMLLMHQNSGLAALLVNKAMAAEMFGHPRIQASTGSLQLIEDAAAVAMGYSTSDVEKACSEIPDAQKNGLPAVTRRVDILRRSFHENHFMQARNELFRERELEFGDAVKQREYDNRWRKVYDKKLIEQLDTDLRLYPSVATDPIRQQAREKAIALMTDLEMIPELPEQAWRDQMRLQEITQKIKDAVLLTAGVAKAENLGTDISVSAHKLLEKEKAATYQRFQDKADTIINAAHGSDRLRDQGFREALFSTERTAIEQESDLQLIRQLASLLQVTEGQGVDPGATVPPLDLTNIDVEFNTLKNSVLESDMQKFSENSVMPVLPPEKFVEQDGDSERAGPLFLNKISQGQGSIT